MQKIRIFGAVAFAALTLVAITASTASAKAKVLHLKTSHAYGFEHVLAPGDIYELETADVFWAYESDGSETRCDPYPSSKYDGFIGRLLSNNEVTDEAEFTKVDGLFNGEGEPCETPIPLGGNVHVYFYGVEPLVTLKLKSNLKAELKANPSEELKIQLYSSDTGQYCTYATKKLKGEIVQEHEGRMLVILKQKVKLKAQHGTQCPKTVTAFTELASWWGEKEKAPRGNGSYYLDEEVF